MPTSPSFAPEAATASAINSISTSTTRHTSRPPAQSQQLPPNQRGQASSQLPSHLPPRQSRLQEPIAAGGPRAPETARRTPKTPETALWQDDKVGESSSPSPCRRPATTHNHRAGPPIQPNTTKPHADVFNTRRTLGWPGYPDQRTRRPPRPTCTTVLRPERHPFGSELQTFVRHPAGIPMPRFFAGRGKESREDDSRARRRGAQNHQHQPGQVVYHLTLVPQCACVHGHGHVRCFTTCLKI